MLTTTNNLLFPPAAIPELRTERGTAWRELVAQAGSAPAGDPLQVAFVLLMARLSNCGTCNSDSFRALQGCLACTRQALKRYHGSDEQLVALFETAREEVCRFCQSAPEGN